MKVVLRQDVKGLGAAGAVLEVADGYGRNYLLPRGLALQATKGNVAQAAGKQAAAARRDAKDIAGAKELAQRLESAPVEVKAKAGERGKLFGAVTNTQIAEAVKSAFGIEVDRHKIELDEPIKAAGDHPCTIRLAQGVSARVTVRVQAD